MQSATWSRVFRIVWRINAVALLLLVLLAIVGITSTLVSALFSSSASKQAPSPNVAPAEAGKPTLRLAQFEQIASTGIIRAELRSPESGSFSIKGGSGTAHNILFIDTADGRSWWLLPNSDLSIEGDRTIALPGTGMDSPLGKVYNLVDPNNPNMSSILLSDLKGIKKSTLASGSVVLDQVVALSPNEAKIIYHDEKGFHVAVVNPVEATKIRESSLSITFPPRK
ncbi:hypothetical protein [Geothrix sp. PMB-07]|uniref:hypothetical protein n=1 Tax=Geothrix sp. PMB-07 TaxID=3068640 RepID=UPI0027417774|nr:hypothetical protein [Geothrix sp. PMB-07]WLT32739.1 hypothetical protein Q9293_05250 [Geothrix sp. PMB-07]